MSGDGFKFSDYYSAFSLDDNVYDINSLGIPSIDYIARNYHIPAEKVERIKDELFDSFPKL